MNWANVLLIGLGVLSVLFLLSIAWRWVSNRWSVPCPAAFSWMVDGSVGEFILKTERTLDRIGLAPGQRVLEIGPGPGRLLIRAAKRILPNGEAVGLELQARMLEKLKRNAQRAEVHNLQVVQGDAAKVRLGNDQFDVIYLSTVLGEIPDRSSVMRNTFDMLRPGGQLSITEIALDPHYQSRPNVAKLAHDAGFEPESVLGSFFHFTANFRKPPRVVGNTI